MAAQTRGTRPENPNHVNVTRYEELVWWAQELRVRPEQVRDAVVQVGPNAEEIRKHLKETAKASFKNMGED
jgi:hypothetical protein